MAYYHIQMHLPLGRGENYEIDSKSLLHEDTPLISTGEWDDIQCRHFKEMSIGDIVLVRKGAMPIALCEVISDCFQDDELKQKYINSNFRKVKVLGWYKGEPPTNERDNYLFSQGTLKPINDINTETGQFIINFLKKIKMNALLDNTISLLKQQKQIILQGAPGTGKTYKTAEIAVKICCPDFEYKSRKELMKKYAELKNRGRIIFTTFHQSMDYEEFIEGIKPVIEQGESISYKIEDGMFKQLCKEAHKSFVQTFVKPNKGDDWSDALTADSVYYSIYDLIIKDIKDGLLYEFRDPCDYEIPFRVIIVGENTIERTCEENGYDEFQKELEWPSNLKGKKNVFFQKSVKRFLGEKPRCLPVERESLLKDLFLYYLKTYNGLMGDEIEVGALTELLSQFAKEYKQTDIDYQCYRGMLWLMLKRYRYEYVEKVVEHKVLDNSLIPYVLIIDEINRGNISKIFGEIITLLEKDKRLGEENELTVTLPYSRKAFGIPSNLYIIGTMNTADRSVGYIDYAIRRRFAFVTLKADRKIIETYYNDATLKAKALLYFDSMSELMQVNSEFNREDLMIGHSYFLAETEEELKNKMVYAVRPLLLEYFNDGILAINKKSDYYKQIESFGE